MASPNYRSLHLSVLSNGIFRLRLIRLRAAHTRHHDPPSLHGESPGPQDGPSTFSRADRRIAACCSRPAQSLSEPAIATHRRIQHGLSVADSGAMATAGLQAHFHRLASIAVSIRADHPSIGQTGSGKVVLCFASERLSFSLNSLCAGPVS